jgi:hypothetical protein
MNYMQVAVLFALVESPLVAQYRSDLEHAFVPPRIVWSFHRPTAIGNIGGIDTVIDLRGFVPMLLPTHAHGGLPDIGDISFQMSWFQVPTMAALHMFYAGDLTLEQVIAGSKGQRQGPWSRTHVIDEQQGHGEDEFWIRLAYATVKDSAQLYHQFVGGGGFQGAEPLTVFLAPKSVFVLLNFRYSSLARVDQGGEGQFLVALEFSRSVREYKAVYPVYTTAPVSKPVGEFFEASLPYVAKAISFALAQ